MAAMAVFVFMIIGVAPAAGAAERSPVLSFSSDRVTLTPPTQGCPLRRPDCEWMLFVNDPTTGKLLGHGHGSGHDDRFGLGGGSDGRPARLL